MLAQEQVTKAIASKSSSQAPIRLAHQDGKERKTVAIKVNGETLWLGIE